MTNPLAQDLGGVVLLPCPMCGGEAHLERQGHVACTTGWPCVHTAYFNSGTPAEQNAAAIAAWNTRAHSAEIGTSAPYPSTTTRSALAVAGVHE